MACKREDRFRHNTIAFWLSDEEKAEVEAKIILSGVPKGEYYRKAVLEQEIKVVSGNYMSFRLSKVLEQICEELHNGPPTWRTSLRTRFNRHRIRRSASVASSARRH